MEHFHEVLINLGSFILHTRNTDEITFVFINAQEHLLEIATVNFDTLEVIQSAIVRPSNFRDVHRWIAVSDPNVTVIANEIEFHVVAVEHPDKTTYLSKKRKPSGS